MYQQDYNVFCICGDFNASFEQNNAQMKQLKELIEHAYLIAARVNNNTVRDYTYINHDLNHRSCIDHFIVSQNVFDVMSSSFVNHSSINLSYHGLVDMSFAPDVSRLPVCTDNESSKSHTIWHQVNDNYVVKYKDKGIENISLQNDVFACSNVMYTEASHQHHITSMCKSMLQCLPGCW